ncbi:RNA polymerase II associated factor Paf1 [Dillenia turbinata]|uniref:RNA polymerase II associated factor Paf1 n=1 Tax=Dillenia turbinata TaxID=194707 RepID=A0AAN8YZ43_9MAGN
MASFRPFPPPQSSFPPPPTQNPVPPPPPPSAQQRGNQYSQGWGFSNSDGSGRPPPAPLSQFPQNYNPQMPPNSNYHHSNYNSSSQHYGPPRTQHPPPPPPVHQQQQYPYPPPPPPPDNSYPPPPPPPPYYTSSQYSQYSQPLPPPPPPSSPPPSSSIPPPPPPSSPPPPPSASQNKEGGTQRDRHERDKGTAKDLATGHSNQHKQLKPPVPHMGHRKPNAPSGRVETEEERRLRKKREFEKQRQEEKHRQQLKESQDTVLRKTQLLSSGNKGGHGSIVGSRMGERRTAPLLGGERIENRLRKPTTFIGKMKFRNELPDPSAQPKLMMLKLDKDRYTRYAITSLEKMQKPQLYVEPDLGIPLDLLDLSVYNPPKEKISLAPEDEELLHDPEPITPVKQNGIKRKERPTDKGVSWLVKTQYISPISMQTTKQSLTEKQAKELRETRGGRNILEEFNSRERKIRGIEGSFEACKSRPVHATNKSLYPIEIMPLLPDFKRYDRQFVVASFDSAPTADSELFGKLDQPVRDIHEAKAVMKSYKVNGTDSSKSEKFLAYMAPSPDELSKDIYDEQEDISYSWVREYHWDVRGDDADDPTTYLVLFDNNEARYLPLPTKLVLRKKRAEGRTSDEVEHFPVPSRVTVRRRSSVAAIEVRDHEIYSSSKASTTHSKRGHLDVDDGLERTHLSSQDHDMDQYSGGEEEMSE